ncbi:MAG TPA: hypothetical protein VNI54_08335 [Thermoanaerobaculia bacterium]|nr:hypothetical protein [Thermoanaerobaculia bacterium]
MSLRTKLGKLLILAVLQFGALAGARVTPEEIEKLMNVMNRVKIVQVVKKDDS